MNENLKKWKIIKRINKWICKYFGHNTVEEVYAVTCDKLFGFPESNSKKAKYLYRIFIEERCERCGYIKTTITSPMRRTELLKQGWFITEMAQMSENTSIKTKD